MILQLVIGGALTLLSIAFSGLGLWLAEWAFTGRRDWLRSPPHAPRLMAVVMGTSLLILALITLDVWIWAVAFLMLDLFVTMEEALYVALTAYTTLGSGQVPHEWRILGALAGANGFINIGLLTTLLIEGLAQVRMGYRRSVLGEDADS